LSARRRGMRHRYKVGPYRSMGYCADYNVITVNQRWIYPTDSMHLSHTPTRSAFPAFLMQSSRFPYLSLVSLCAVAALADDPRPNFVFVMSDDQGWGDVAYYGHPRLETPELDAMAAEALRVDNFFAGAPVCSPTRATCLTGRHHLRSGITWVNDNYGVINARETTIADALSANGYRTGHFGKWHLKDPRWNSTHNPGQLGFQYWIATSNNAEKVDPEGYFHMGDPVNDTLGEDSAVIMDYALEFIEDSVNRGKPFFANIWMHTPHSPYGSTQEFLDRYSDVTDANARAYYASITAMDVQIGRLRDALRAMGIADNTLLVFCSDNGPEGPGSAGPWPGGKRGITDGGLRVPGIIEWPSVITEPRVTQTPIVTSDLYPTFLAAAGIADFGPARPIDGENVLPELMGHSFTRAGPIRFMISGNRGVTYPDGTFSNTNLDPDYAAWEAEVMAEFDLAWAAKMELVANQPPRADAGEPVFAVWSPGSPTASVTLDASASSDPDGTIMGYAWSWEGGTASGPSFTADFPPGRTEVTLTVTDDDGTTDIDTVGVHVLLENERFAPWEETNGMVVIEAEAFTEMQRPAGKYPWRITDEIPHSVGGLSLHVDEHGAGWYSSNQPPVFVSYPVTVASAGSYTLWSRRFAPGDRSDSVYVAVNGVQSGQEYDNSGPFPRLWHWANYGTYDLPAGASSIEIWFREDGLYLDRLVLAGDPAFTPDGEGPPASPRAGIGVPVANLQALPMEGNPPLLVQFDASGSSDADGSIVSYAFTFGDGSPVVTQASPFASHTYLSNGQFTASVSVTDDIGLVGIAHVGIGIGNTQPVAIASADPSTGYAPLEVVFDGSASYDNDGSITSWQWDLDGDGVGDGSGSSISHTFQDAGTYPVTLLVTDNEGGTASDTVSVVVDPPLPSGTVSLEAVDSGDLGNPSFARVSFPMQPANDSVFVVATFTKSAEVVSITLDPGGMNLPLQRLVSTPASNPDLTVYLYAADMGDISGGPLDFTISYSTSTASAFAAYQLSGTSVDTALTTFAATVDTPLTVPSLPAGSAVIDLQIDGSTSSDGLPYGSPDSTIRFTATGNRGFISGLYANREGDVTAGYNGNAAQGSVAAGFSGIAESPYLIWMDGFPELTGADRDPDADPNEDGLTNRFSFFHDIPPVPPGLSGQLLTGVVPDDPLAPGAIVFEFRKRAGSGSHVGGGGTVDGIPYQAEWSSNGTLWNHTDWSHLQTITQSDGSELIRLSLPESRLFLSGKLLFRLNLQ